jgi:hypothetical protein
MLLLYAIIAGLVLGRLDGGRLSALAEVHFRWWGLALGGLAFQLLLFSGPLADRVGAAGPALYMASTLAVFAAMLRNRQLPGFGILALGACLNLVAIAANGGYMPSSPDAWVQLNGVAQLPITGYTNAALAGAHTLLPFLGDIFVLPRPLPFATVFSIGDVLIGVGAATFLIRTMHRPVVVATLTGGTASVSAPSAAPR